MALINYKAVEDYLLNQLLLFAKDATGITKVFQTDQTWPEVKQPMLGLQVISVEYAPWATSEYFEADDTNINTVSGTYVIEIIAVNQPVLNVAQTTTPMSTLMQLNHALYGFNALRYKHFTSKNIGFLDATSPTRTDSIQDGLNKQQRARMTVFLTMAVSDADPIKTTTIDKVQIEQNVYQIGVADPITINFLIDPLTP